MKSMAVGWLVFALPRDVWKLNNAESIYLSAIARDERTVISEHSRIAR